MTPRPAGHVVVLGSCNLDVIVEVAALPTPGQTVLGHDAVVRVGGKGANQAVAARRLGAPTAFVGALGTDQFAAGIRDALTRENLDLSGLIEVAGPTGMALVIVEPGGENVIAVASGANRHVTPERFAGLLELLRPGDVLVLQLETPVRTSLAAAELARAARASVVLNAAPISDATDGELATLFGLVDVLVVNEGEARALCPDLDGAADRLASALRALGPPVVVVTLGPRGAVLADRDRTLALAPSPVVAVDSTGAGDAFCGAVAAALAGGRALPDAVRLGCAAGALATTAVGAQSALPTLADVTALLAAKGTEI
jgi:ribokinase